MIELDHIAINTNDLEKSLEFYKNIGYKLKKMFNDVEYRWVTLSLGKTNLEIFETKKVIPHIAYNFSNDKEVFQIAKSIGYDFENLEIFNGNLNRKSFFIKDNNGISIQFIKKEK